MNHQCPDLTWEFYNRENHRSDSFKTRYLHYLRWITILKMIEFIKKNVKNEALYALDIGCNRGYYSKKLGDLDLIVDAVDRNLVSDLLQLNPNITYIEEDFLEWEPPRSYDLIMALEVYEHISPEDRDTFIHKIIFLLKPNGILLFSDPKCYSLHYGLGFLKYWIKKKLGQIKDIDWHYRIPFQYYNQIFVSIELEIIPWENNGILAVISNTLEKIFIIISPQRVMNLELWLSKTTFNGFEANYHAIMVKKGD